MLTGADAVALAGPDELLAFAGPGADHHRPGDPLDGLIRAHRDERVHVEPRLPCTHPGCPLRSAIVAPLAVREPPDRPARRALRAPGAGAAGGVARRRRGGGARLGDGRAVRGRGAGRAARARRAARAARADLAALHLQRAGRRRRVHPLAPGRGARAADRVLRVHPLRVRPPAAVRDARRRAAVRREVPAAGAGPLRRAPARAGAGRPGGAARRRPRPVAAAARGERGAPRRRVAARAAGS